VPQNHGLHLVTEDEAHKVTSIELFFDLVFVYAITQTTQLMANHLDLLGIGQGLAMLAALWWCWCSYAWLGNTLHADRGVARLAMFAAMAVMFLLAQTIPEAFTDFPGGLYAPALFVGCYFAVRLLHLVAYLQVARTDPALRGVLLRILPGVLISVAILAVAAFTHGLVQLGLWVLALVVDYGRVYFSGAAGWSIPSPAHFAERFGGIMIIALGESIVAIGIGIGSLPLSWLVVLAALCGLALVAAMWWMYFDVVARVSEAKLTRTTGIERAKIATDSYTFLHLPLIAGIVLVALGLKKALLYVADTEHYRQTDPLHGAGLWALTSGLAVYLVTLSALRRRNLGSWNTQRLVVAVVLLAVTPALGHVPAAALLSIIAAAGLALVTFERFRFAGWRRQVHNDHP
jgi:low temperature requirement protein LtrA